MEDTTLVDKLISFGVGRQEAVIYLCLLKSNELTGYEVAKLTGISRSNVYNALAALVEHGAAYTIEGTSTKYVAVPVGEFCENHIRHLTEVKEHLVQNCPKYTLPSGGYITIEGYKHICDKIHHILMGACQRVYFSATSVFLEEWKEEINELVNRRIKVVLISDKLPDALSEVFIREHIIFYPSLSVNNEENNMYDRNKQVRLIVDSTSILTGEVEGSAMDTCLYSAQKNFVNVFKEAMRNEIKLIELSNKEAQERK